MVEEQWGVLRLGLDPVLPRSAAPSLSPLAGIGAFPAGARQASATLSVAAGTALVAGAMTLLWQRRPERRVGTLASLTAGLIAIGAVWMGWV